MIFCRNVLIYFDDASRRIAAENLYENLLPGGFICLGHTESMSRISPLFEVAASPTPSSISDPRGNAVAERHTKASPGRRRCSLVRLYYRTALESAGFVVEEALNGLEALEKLLTAPFDLLIVDVNMPQMDGFTFLQTLRAKSCRWRRFRRW